MRGACGRVDLFRQQAQVADVGDQFVPKLACLARVPVPHQRVDQPE